MTFFDRNEYFSFLGIYGKKNRKIIIKLSALHLKEKVIFIEGFFNQKPVDRLWCDPNSDRNSVIFDYFLVCLSSAAHRSTWIGQS
jgi:hypothetical protein